MTVHLDRLPFTAHLILLAVGVAATLPALSSAADADTVQTMVSLQSAPTPQPYTLLDKPLDFDTPAGRLRFRLSELQSVTAITGSDAYQVQTADGSIWITTLRTSRLPYQFLDTFRELPVSGRQLSSAVTLPASRVPIYSPSQVRVLLENGSQVMLRTDGFDLDVENACGRWSIPIGAVSAVKFLHSSDADERDVAIIRFMTGHVERIAMRSTAPIKASDVFGNSVRLALADIKGILGITAVTELVSGAGDKSFFGCATAYAANGQPQRFVLPTIVWTISTDWGRIALPSQSVADIIPSDGRNFTVRTIFGESFIGRLAPSSIKIPVDGSEDAVARLDPAAWTRTEFAAACRALPAGWLVWHMRSGTAFCARFAGADDVVPIGEESRIHPDNLFSVAWANKDHLVAVSRSQATRLCKPRARKVKAVLLSNGMSIDIPWKDISGIYTKSSIASAVPDPSPSEMAPSTAEIMAVASVRAHASPGPVASLRLKTELGRFELPASAIASVLYDPDSRYSGIQTVCGGRFAVSSLGEDALNTVANAAVLLPKSGVVEIVNPAAPTRMPTPPAACRLRSGDVFPGRIESPELQVYAAPGSKERLEIETSQIQSIYRNDDNDLELALDSGRILGAPRDRTMEFFVAAFDTTTRVAFADLDALVVGPPSQLPPPTAHSSRTALLAPGMVRVPGGSYAQGRLLPDGPADETPRHKVSLDAFLIDASEITRSQFAAFVADTRYKSVAEITGSSLSWRTPGFLQQHDHPVVCVAWFDAVQYCNWRSGKAGLDACYDIKRDGSVIVNRLAAGFRLPTETEWEFAARAGGREIQYPWGNEDGYRMLNDATTPLLLANYQARPGAPADPWEWTNPVTAFAANPLGIFGMGGNVWEWCEDWYFDRAYAQRVNLTIHSPCLDNNEAELLSRRVMRGGSFKNDIDLLRCTSRGSGIPAAFSDRVGFRCVRNAPELTRK